jgi:hypothetical protein
MDNVKKSDERHGAIQIRKPLNAIINLNRIRRCGAAAHVDIPQQAAKTNRWL